MGNFNKIYPEIPKLTLRNLINNSDKIDTLILDATIKYILAIKVFVKYIVIQFMEIYILLVFN